MARTLGGHAPARSVPRSSTGRIWFCGQAGHYLAYFVPETGEFKRYDLEPGTGPHNLIVDKSGIVWFSGNLVGYIGRLDPNDGSIKKYPMPDPMVRDPHTLVFDKNGDIWFSARAANAIGRLTVSSGKVQLSRSRRRMHVLRIKLDSKGHPWGRPVRHEQDRDDRSATMQLREITSRARRRGRGAWR